MRVFNFAAKNKINIQINFSFFQIEWQKNECNAKELFDKSVVECLYWACSKSKWNTSSGDNNLAMKLVDIHKIIPSQFEWIVLNERARSKAWLDLETIFQKKVRPCCFIIIEIKMWYFFFRVGIN